LVLLFEDGTNQEGMSVTSAFEVFSYETPTLSLQLDNKYHDSFDLYPFDYIAAAYLETNLTVVSDINYDYTQYHWKIEEKSYIGQTVTHTFTNTGYVIIEVKITYGKEKLESAQTFSIMVRHVRRELRSLTDEDRDKILSVMEIMYYTPSVVGKTIYGENYRSISDFMLDHLKGAAQKTCDHWHDDAGIMVHHLAFTLDFENAMRLIDPSVSLPYWEYTYDAYIYGSNWEDSEIFNSDWFGVASPDNSLHIITEGRWAFLPVMQNAGKYSSIVNPYGLLRSPWNTNPVPYVNRYDKVLNETSYTEFPTCSQFAIAFKATTISQMNFYLNGGLHGPVHIMIGGHWNEFVNTDLATAVNNIQATLLYSKSLWRLGFIRCPETCDEDEDPIDCRCTCPVALRQGKSAYEVLEYSKILHLMVGQGSSFTYDDDSQTYKFNDVSDEDQDESWEILLSIFCSVGHAGEMFTSGAPYDPTFWIIHTSAERFLQFRRFSSYYGSNPFDETWGYDLEDQSSSDFRRICDWDDVGDDEMPTCTTGTCPGHLMHDTLPEQYLIQSVQRFTNSQFYTFLDPRNEHLPYVYDNFDWDHCTAQGVSFDF